MSTENSPQLQPSETYRFVVRSLGRRRHATTAATFRYVEEYGCEVVDSWTGDVMIVRWAHTEESASLVAETQCAEWNAPATGITFPSKLALFVERALESETHPGNVLDDVSRILEWHLGRLRGTTREPLDQTRLYHQAPEFNQ